MIRKFGVRDFKGHRDTQLELGRFTMLVGDNASGKTSVLDALALQDRLGCHAMPLLQAELSLHDLVRRGSDGPIQLTCSGVQENVPWSASFSLRPQRVNAAPDQFWEASLVARVGTEDISSSSNPHSYGGPWVSTWARIAHGRAASYRLRAEQIAAAAYSEQPGAAIEQDGTNTAVALSAMKLGNDEAFERVEAAMRRLIPSVERVRIRQATVHHPGLGDVVGSKLYFDFRGAPRIPADGASHGTLIVVALLAILHGANRPDLILLDDFDHALHPRAQMELVRMIQELLALPEFHDVQVVATTHSPYVLDGFDPGDIYAFALRDNGTVASKRLSEHPEAEKTRGTLKAGQLWSLDPERDWVLQG